MKDRLTKQNQEIFMGMSVPLERDDKSKSSTIIDAYRNIMDILYKIIKEV